MPPLGHVRALHSQSDLVADRQPLPAHLAGRGTTWAKAQLERRADSCNANHSTRRDGGQAITSFAIVTADAAPCVAQYHNRMPVVLDDSQFDDWMRGTPDQAAGMMKPYAGAIEAWEGDAEGGNGKNNRPELIESVGAL